MKKTSIVNIISKYFSTKHLLIVKGKMVTLQWKHLADVTLFKLSKWLNINETNWNPVLPNRRSLEELWYSW